MPQELEGKLMFTTSRRFPPPCRVVEIASTYRVDNAGGQALAYFYFRDEENVAQQASVLTRDEARRRQRISRGCLFCSAEERDE
jgi:hypothetical protein